LRLLAARLLHHAADALDAARCLTPHDALRHMDARRSAGRLGVLDVLGALRRGLGHVDRAAADKGAASDRSRQFRKGHPNRHVLVSLLPRP
jgi:hypothetical protein